MSDDAPSVFSHPISDLIIASVVDGRTCKYALDDVGRRKILEAAQEALKTPEAQDMLDTLVDVADFLDTQDGAEAAATVMDVAHEIERTANEDPEAVGDEFEGFDDDDGVELTYGRRAASVLGRKTVTRAPEVGANKDQGVSLQSLIGTKRRI